VQLVRTESQKYNRMKEEKGNRTGRPDVQIKPNASLIKDGLCGLVVRVPAYRSSGPGSIFGAGSTQPRDYN
jgi:hypothetical protein